jgi:hypothetical protein
MCLKSLFTFTEVLWWVYRKTKHWEWIHGTKTVADICLTQLGGRWQQLTCKETWGIEELKDK